MPFFFLSVFCSALNHLIFKTFQRVHVAVLPAVTVNYLVCVVIGRTAWSGAGPSGGFAPWQGYAAGQGLLLIGSFLLMAVTTQKSGVAAAALASRLSIVIPVLLAFFLYGDAAGPLKLTGVAGALAALFLSSMETRGAPRPAGKGARLLPLCLALMFGANLTLAKYAQAHVLDDDLYHGYLALAFAAAFLIGLVALTGMRLSGVGSRPTLKDAGAGVILGVNNYGSVYFLIKTLAQPGWESSVVFPAISVSVVALSFLGGVALFKERLSRPRILALAVGVGAIVCMNV